MSNIQIYRFPGSLLRDETIRVLVSDDSVEVLASGAEPFVTFGCDGPVEITIEFPLAPERVSISPRRHNLEAVKNDAKVKFTLPGPMHLAVHVDGMPALFIFANPIESNIPNPDDDNVILIREGDDVDAGETVLASGQSLYIQGGGVLRGRVRSRESKGVSIAGYGILDGSSAKWGTGRTRLVMFSDCEDVLVRNVIMVRPSAWMLVVDTCEKVHIEDVKQIGTWYASDGVDIVSSRNVTVSGCFMRNGDDCVVIKSLDISETGERTSFRDVSDVTIEGCAFLSYLGGSAMEIGYELRCKRVSGIRFQDCDVLGVHQYGSVFGIHNSDGAVVEDVAWKNIRVEQHYDKLVDLRIITSRWGKDPTRGYIRNIRLQDIDVFMNDYNDGYSCSIIGGYDEGHLVEGVTFANFKLGNRWVANADELSLFTRRATGITFGANTLEQS